VIRPVPPLDRLLAVARLRGFPRAEDAAPALLAYVEAVVEEGRALNLTAASGLAEAVEVIGVSALAVCRAWTRPEPPRVVVDVGTGNGLPGVAAALAWPDARVWLVERRAKKAEAVRRCLARAGPGNATVVTGDGRELARLRPEVVGATDLVLARAVGPLEALATMAASWLAPGGRIAHWKGAGLGEEERGAGQAAAARAGLVVLPDLCFADDAGPARIVVYERPAARRRGKEA
jgi:16S rRNA (guanine527-N7)-methyltransferase